MTNQLQQAIQTLYQLPVVGYKALPSPALAAGKVRISCQ